MNWAKVKERLLGVVVTVVTALVCFYFGSFATKSQVELLAQEVSHHKQDVLKNYPTQADINRIEGKIDTLKTAVCIIEPRTCKL